MTVQLLLLRNNKSCQKINRYKYHLVSSSLQYIIYIVVVVVILLLCSSSSRSLLPVLLQQVVVVKAFQSSTTTTTPCISTTIPVVIPFRGRYNNLYPSYRTTITTYTTTTSVTTICNTLTNTVNRVLYFSNSYLNNENNEIVSKTTNTTTTTVDTASSSLTPCTSTATTPPPVATTTRKINKYINMSIQAIGSSTTIVVSGIFFIVLAYKRNTHMISFFIGAILNGILSKILKKCIQQTRPKELYNEDNESPTSKTTTGTTSEIRDKPMDHGMPSSHAMSLGFICTFIVCNFISLRIPLLLYTIISLYYRVQVRLHTYPQIMVGTILGSSNGYIWYKLCIGHNPFHIHVMNLVKQYLFHNQEQLPIPYLIVPFLVGALTIGSFERRISALLRRRRKVTKAA